MHMFVLSNNQARLVGCRRTFLYSVIFGKLLMDSSILKMRLLDKSCYLFVTSAPDIYGVSFSS